MKRNLITGIVVILAIISVVFYFSKTEHSFFKETSFYPAIPVSVPLFVEINSLKSLPYDSPLFEKWLDVEKINSFRKWIHQLDSIIKENGDIQSGLRSDRFVVAFGLMGDNQLTPLVMQKAESNGRKNSIEKLVRVLYPEPEFSYTEIDYTGYKIISGSTANSKKSINYCFASGLLVASTNLVLVQQSLLQLTEPGITRNSSFTLLTKSFKAEPDIAWFVNQNLFPDFLLEYVNSSSFSEINEFGENVKRNHYRNVRDYKRFASWSELETEFDESEILLKGLTVANDTANNFLSVFEGQNPKGSDAGDILPANTSFFTCFSFSNKKLFFEKLERYFSLAGAYYKREDLVRKMEIDLKVDFKKTFQSMVKSEMIVAITGIPTETAEKTTYFMFDVNGKSKTENLLDSMLTIYAERKNMELANFKSVFSLNEKKEFTIIEFPFPSFPGIWMGKPFYSAQAKYAVFYKDFLVFCNTAGGLQNYITNMEEKNLMADDPRFKRIESSMENKSNISAYFNIGRGINLSGELLTAELVKKLEKKKDILRRIQAVGWKVSGGDKVFSNEISLIFENGISEEGAENDGSTNSIAEMSETPILWQCNFGNPLVTKPIITVNHTDKVNREIVIQDKLNKLHQINYEGKINWSIDLEEPIVSEIFQIDYLANGKLQYLFSSKNKLYLVDRNGSNVEGFPLKFPTEATAGVSVFDYDNNRIYRYFVPCSDKKIMAYNKNGKIISDWNFEGTKTIVTTPVQYFKVGGKDYIVFKDKNMIYIQNRKGETVVKITKEFENSRNLLILSPGRNPKIIATDNKGIIYEIDFDGNITEKKVGKFDDDHFFTSDDLNGDKLPEYVFVDRKELTVTDENGTVLFTQKFANSIQHQPNIYSFGANKKKIGIVDSKANRIYLIDDKGQSQVGFPLQGVTEFSIGKIKSSSQKLNLIVGSKSGSLVCYALD